MVFQLSTQQTDTGFMMNFMADALAALCREAGLYFLTNKKQQPPQAWPGSLALKNPTGKMCALGFTF